MAGRHDNDYGNAPLEAIVASAFAAPLVSWSAPHRSLSQRSRRTPA
jgi:hypothetical protein